jgi:hypothetical protein
MIQTFFHPGSYMKSGMQTYLFLAYAFRSKFLVLVRVKKIRDPEKIHPGSGSRISDPGGKKAPDPGSVSATKQQAIGIIILQAHGL